MQPTVQTRLPSTAALGQRLGGCGALRAKPTVRQRGPQRLVTRCALSLPQRRETWSRSSPASGCRPSIAEALDFKPSTTLIQDALCLGTAAAVAAGTASGLPICGACAGAGAAGLLTGLLAGAAGRSWLLGRQVEARQWSERELASPHSRFLRVDNIDVHYTVHRPPPGPRLWAPQQAIAAQGLHCVHGLGANTSSFALVQDALAQRLGAVVTAHDVPGFGLTQRPRKPRDYSLAFNTRAIGAVMDRELPRSRAGAGRAPRAGRVLVGHSLGGAAVAEYVIAHPEDVAAVVLLAPCIVAQAPTYPEQVQRLPAAAEALPAEEQGFSGSPPSLGSFSSYGSSLDSGDEGPVMGSEHISGTACAAGSASLAQLTALLGQAASGAVLRGLLCLSSPLMALLLRHLVRDRRFWELGLGAAWADRSRLNRRLVDAYRYAQLVRGWEEGLVLFLQGRLAEQPSLGEVLRHAARGSSPPSQAERLAQAVKRHHIPVLVVHGRDDLLISADNSRRLAAMLPGARYVEVVRCGHMPQEEAPARFVQAVADFLQGVRKGED